MPNRRHLLAVMLFWAAMLAGAQPGQLPGADDDDFVQASLLTISPGSSVVTCFGHAAIRLQCPAHGLDYCFTFEMKPGGAGHLQFLAGRAKAGYLVAPTPHFLEQYRRQGRGICEYDLNLTPRQEQELWRLLDREVARGACWDYDFITVNCGSMCAWIVERALQGEHIVYHDLPAALTGTYSDAMNVVAADAPWMNLYFHLRYFGRRADSGHLDDKMAPELLAQAWQQATLASDSLGERPMLGGQRTLLVQTYVPQPTWLTPAKALWLIIILVIIILILKINHFMKKIFTSMRSKRFLLSAALAAMTAGTAWAGGEDWYAYNVQVDAYPTGAGLVYVDIDPVDDESAIEWKDSYNREYTTTAFNAYGYAKANEGWQLLGFTKDTLDTNGNWVRLDTITHTLSPDYAYLTLDNGVQSKHIDPESGSEVSDDSLTVSALMPLDPNNYFRAVFTHVAVVVNPEQTERGSATIDKLSNNIGDRVTLKATPANDKCAFASWTLDGVEVSKEATLTIDVTKAATYQANFTDSRSVVLHFPEEGGYQVWYDDYDYLLHNKLQAYSPMLYFSSDNTELVDQLNEDQQRVSHLDITSSGYMVSGKKPAILYGVGDVEIAPDGVDVAADNDESYSCSLFRWSGESGVQVADLPTEDIEKETTYLYYTFDTRALQFNRITSGAIAPNTLYMRIFGKMVASGQEAPEVIYFDADTYEQAATAVGSVKAAAASLKAVYDLLGRRVPAAGRQGIYVTDGKKVVYRQK